MAEPGTSFSQRLGPALLDSLLAAIIAFALFGLLLGLRTVDKVTGLTLEPRPALLAVAVGIVFFGRLLLNLFVWHAEYPLTTPFAKLFSSDPFTRRDINVLGIAAALAAVILIAGMVIGNPACKLVGICVLVFMGLGVVRRTIVHVFPNLPYGRIFTVGGIAFAVLFPICSYLLDKAFHLNLPLRYLFDLSILVLTYIMLGWGLNVVVGLAGLLDLGYVAFYAVGAYTFALLATHFGLGFWICLPIAGAAAALWGIVLGFPVLQAPRRLSRHRDARLRRDRPHHPPQLDGRDQRSQRGVGDSQTDVLRLAVRRQRGADLQRILRPQIRPHPGHHLPLLCDPLPRSDHQSGDVEIAAASHRPRLGGAARGPDRLPLARHQHHHH